MRRDQLKALLKLGRFRFILAGFLLYCLGALWALYMGSPFDLGNFTLGYLILFPAHLSVSYSNDYFDRESDLAGTPGPVSGGSGVLREYPELAGWARGIAITLIAASLLLGIVCISLNSIGGWFLLFIIAGNALGWFYSAPPLRLSRTRLGEAAMAVTMGFLVPGMGYYIIRGGFDIGYLILAVPCFLYGYFFMIAVEMPDRESDRVSGKNTLVVRRGVTYAYGVALLATALATLLLVIPSLLGFYLPGLALLGICSVIPLLCSARWYTSLCPDEPCIVGRSARGILALVAFVTLGDLVLLLAVARL